jgi:hypothetical protein
MKRAMIGLALASVGGGALAVQAVHTTTGSLAEKLDTLKPGQFIWRPNAAPAGPVLIVVDIPSQRAVVYRNGVPIGATTVSTGAPGHETPTGVFTILQKRQEHYSSIYNNAPMPYMQRLTWDGIALHAGKLPGYPASKGCIRLPLQFSKLVFGVTKTGMTVVITDKAEVPKIVPTPNLAPATYFARADMQWHPEKSAKGPVSIVISAADQKAYVIRNGVPIGTSPVKIDRAVDDTLAFEYRNDDKNGPHWIALELHDNGKNTGIPRDEWEHIHAPPQFKKLIAQVMHPGAVILVTPESLHQGSTGMKLTVIDTDEAKKSKKG